MTLTEQFDAAAERAKHLPPQSNQVLLDLYALYKQAKFGDVSGSKPGAFDLRGQAKYAAWKGLSGKSREDAMREYVAMVDDLG